MNLSFEPPPPYDLGPEPDVGLWLAEWGGYADRIVHLGPDDGRDHGRLCWDVLAPTGLLAPHCGHCRHGHGGPRSVHDAVQHPVHGGRGKKFLGESD